MKKKKLENQTTHHDIVTEVFLNNELSNFVSKVVNLLSVMTDNRNSTIKFFKVEIPFHLCISRKIFVLSETVPRNKGFFVLLNCVSDCAVCDVKSTGS